MDAPQLPQQRRVLPPERAPDEPRAQRGGRVHVAVHAADEELRRLLVPTPLQPARFLFDADGLVTEMDRHFTEALEELPARRAAAARAAASEQEEAEREANLAAVEPGIAGTEAMAVTARNDTCEDE